MLERMLMHMHTVTHA